MAREVEPRAVHVAPEMSRPFALARLGAGAAREVVATPGECAALAVRMGVPEIHALRCSFDLHPAGMGVVQAKGSLRASVQQICIVSLDAFDSEVAEDFSVRFVPAGTESEEIDIEADDEIGYENGIIDLGEAASEQLALALDPFPRKPGLEDAELPSEAQAGAFAALAKLRTRQGPTDG